MNPAIISQLIKDNTLDSFIDMAGIASSLSVRISLCPELRDLCTISLVAKTVTIKINPDLDVGKRLTFVAIALAEYILTPSRVTGTGITYDIFFLKDIYSQRFSYRMLLATRLAVPERVIQSFGGQGVGSSAAFESFKLNSKHHPDFLRCCVQEGAAMFLLTGFNDLPKNINT
jgi:hypothetical protein